MNYLKALLPLLILIVAIVSLNTQFGTIPPIGKFVDPESGFWANAEIELPESNELAVEGFDGKASVYFDERRVPHIFAENEYDLYFAQGYVVARDRLFQMELQTLDASGRLAEKIGERALSRDKTTRRRGMPYGAEKALEMMKQDPKSWEIVNAYADGVNAYISSLEPKNYPLEYKILDFEPEEWTPIKAAHLLKNMTRTLAGGNNDDRTSNTMEYFGVDFIEKFFENKPELNDPIIPSSKEWDFERIPVEAPA
jgi:penicillin amidase